MFSENMFSDNNLEMNTVHERKTYYCVVVMGTSYKLLCCVWIMLEKPFILDTTGCFL